MKTWDSSKWVKSKDVSIVQWNANLSFTYWLMYLFSCINISANWTTCVSNKWYLFIRQRKVYNLQYKKRNKFKTCEISIGFAWVVVLCRIYKTSYQNENETRLAVVVCLVWWQVAHDSIFQIADSNCSQTAAVEHYNNIWIHHGKLNMFDFLYLILWSINELWIEQ